MKNKTSIKKETKFNDYEGFVEKFKPKKTTDDCYTPSYIYDEVIGWLIDNGHINNTQKIVRPFWPGADFQKSDYPEGCVVVDNPPFSIMSSIKRWFQEKGIRFFLFSPHLTLFQTYFPEHTYIITNASIIYENGANVSTDFVTNIPSFSGCGIMCASSLRERIIQSQKLNLKKIKNPQYIYPDNVITTSVIASLLKGGKDISIPHAELEYIRNLDNQIPLKKSIYGNGFLCSDRIAQLIKVEKENAYITDLNNKKNECIEKEKKAIRFSLSEREKKLIKSLTDENNRLEKNAETAGT